MFKLFKKTKSPTHCECHGDLERLQELCTQLGIKEKEKEDFIKNSVFKYNVVSFNFYNEFDRDGSTQRKLYKIILDERVEHTWKYDNRIYNYENIWANERLGIATVLSYLFNIYRTDTANGFIEVSDKLINKMPKYSAGFLRDLSKIASDLADFLERDDDRKSRVAQYDEEIKQIKKEIDEIKERLHIQ